MKGLHTLTGWMRPLAGSKAWRLVAVAVLLAGIIHLGPPAPTASAIGGIQVDRVDDPPVTASGSGAAACTPAASDCSLRGAVLVANANPGSEIVLAHGTTYTLTIAGANAGATTGDLNITANTTIDHGTQTCSGRGCDTIIQGGTGWNDRIFNIASGVSVQIDGSNLAGEIIIQNGKMTGGGGLWNDGNLTLNSVTIRNNTATNGIGGGISNAGYLTVTNSTLISNTASTAVFGGGGVFNMGTATISGSTITQNTAANGGGGIYNTGGSLTLSNTAVTTNTAQNFGGGISASCPLTITNSLINGNVITAVNQVGGGLYYIGSDAVNISGTDISGNRSNGEGAGIFANEHGLMTMTNVTVTNNINNASGAVGFEFTGGGTLNFTGGSISGNSGTGLWLYDGNLNMSGGAVVNGNTDKGINIRHTASSTIDSSTISNNRCPLAYEEGCGINLLSGVLTMTNSTVTGNVMTTTLASYGGGILVDSGAALTLNGSTVYSNTAYYGGGIYTGGVLTVTNSTVSMNTAAGQVGGIDIFSGTTTLSNTTVAANQAPSFSGIAVNSPGILKLKNSLIGNNFGSSDGQCYGVVTSLGYNLLGTPCSLGVTNTVNGDLVGTISVPLDPYLGPLALNGGTTRTHGLMQGSPAINAGDPVNCPATDQTGITARPQWGRCDIGAYEYSGTPYPVPGITSLVPSTMVKNCTAYATTLTVNGSNFLPNSAVRLYTTSLYTLTTTYISGNQLTAVSDVGFCTVGPQTITVFNPAINGTSSGGGGGVSNSATLTVTTAAYVYLPLVQR